MMQVMRIDGDIMYYLSPWGPLASKVLIYGWFELGVDLGSDE